MTVEFCDTNVLVYAYDRSAGEKRERAARLLDRLWQTGNGAVSIQVLQELFVTLTGKLQPSLPADDARSLVSDLTAWRVVEPTTRHVLRSIDAAREWTISFWDAMVIVAAIEAGAEILWTEDLNHGQTYGSTTAMNPFASG